MATKITLTKEQKQDLAELCEAIKAAGAAKRLRERLRAFSDDNEDALRAAEGLVINGLRLSLKISKRLDVEEAE